MTLKLACSWAGRGVSPDRKKSMRISAGSSRPFGSDRDQTLAGIVGGGDFGEVALVE